MIKKIFLWLFVWFVWLISFSNAKTQEIWLDRYPSTENSNYSIWFLKWWGLLSSYLWTAKSVLAINNDVLFWRAPNWQPYFYSPWFQWFFGEYFACDELTWLDSVPKNCSSIPITWDFQVIWKGFFDQVKAWDYAYYWYTYWNNSSVNWFYYRAHIQVCWSSHEIWNSLCFWYNRHNSSQWSTTPDVWSLVNSQNLSNFNFGLLSSSWIWYAPWQAWYDWWWNIDWWSTEVTPWFVTWDVMLSECTKQKALAWYRANGYKSRMCYSSYWNNTDLYTWPWDAVWYALTWTDVLDVWFDTWDYRRNWLTGEAMWYDEWFSYWRNTYNVYKKNSQHTNPFLGVPVSIFTLMWNVDAYGLPYNDQSVLEFCDLSLYTADYNAIYTGVASSVVCSMSTTEYLDAVTTNQLNPDWGYPWYMWSSVSWTVTAIWSSWDWVTNRPWFHNIPWSSWSASQSWLSTYQDWVSFQNWYFNLLKDNFSYPEWTWDWIVPFYIIIALCWLVFFRFLSH